MAETNLPRMQVGMRSLAGTIHGLDTLTLCSLCGGHELVLHGDLIQCHDCGKVNAVIVSEEVALALAA
jgi:hypothetical protein